MSKGLDYYIQKKSEEAGKASSRKNQTYLEAISNAKKTSSAEKKSGGLSNYINATYGSLLGQQKGPYAQAIENNRERMSLGESLDYLKRRVAGDFMTGVRDVANAIGNQVQIGGRNIVFQQALQDGTGADAFKVYEETNRQPMKQLSDWGTEYSARTDEMYTPGKVLQTVGDVAGGISRMAPSLAAGAINPVLGTGVLVAGATGGATRQALEAGATNRQAVAYGTAVGGVEAVAERLFGGVAKLFGAGAADDVIEAVVGKMATTDAGRSALRVLVQSGGEGMEEVVASVMDPLLQTMYNGKTVKESYKELQLGDVMYDYLVGALVGGVINTASIPAGRTANEVLRQGVVEEALGKFWSNMSTMGAFNEETRRSFKAASEAIENTRSARAGKTQSTDTTQPAGETLTQRVSEITAEEKTAQRAAETRMEGSNENLSDAGQGDRNDGVGAGGPGGVFSAAAGEPQADGRRNLGQNGRGAEAAESEVLQEVSPAELGIAGGDAESRVKILNAERAGGVVADAADTVRSAGMEPVAFRGEMRVGNASVNGYMENGRIYFRTDAVDGKGRAITPEQIVEHELFHASAEPETVRAVSEAVREQMTETEFAAMCEDYKRAYSKVQDFSGWTAEEIAEYLYQEITADAYAGLNYFNDAPETVEAARAATPQAGQAQTDQSGAETRGPPEYPRNEAALYTDPSVYSYDFLTKQKDMKTTKLPPTSDVKGRTRGEIAQEGIRNAGEVGEIKDGIGYVKNSYTGRVLKISPSAITHGLEGNATRFLLNAQIGAKAGEIVQNAIPINGLVKENRQADGTYAMAAYATDNNQNEYIVIVTVLHFGDHVDGIQVVDVTHAMSGRRKNNRGRKPDQSPQESADGISLNPSAIDTITIADLLDVVNGTHKGILSEDVLNTLGEEKPKEGYYADRALFSVEVQPERLTQQERTLVNDRVVTLNRDGKKVEVEIRRASTGQWYFSVRAVGGKPVYDETPYSTPQEAAQAAMSAAETYSMPKETRTRKALNDAADEAVETPPPIGRFTKAEHDAEEERIRTLVEGDAPWGTGDVMREQDTEGQAAADEFAQERAERQAAQSMEEDFAEFNDILRGQIPVQDEKTAEKKVTTDVEVEKIPKKKRASNTWRSLKRTIVNAGDTIHRIARETGNKALDGYYFRALASRQAGTEWITGKRHDLLGRVTGKGLNEIFSPIRAKGQEYYEQFQLYLYHMLNIDRMSRDYAAEAREAQAEVDRLLRVEPKLAYLSPEELKRIAEGFSLDAQLAKDYIEAVEKRNRAEKRKAKPVFGFDVTADDSRAAVERLLEKHPEFAELAQDVYDYSNDLLQYRVDAGLIQQKDKDYLQRLYPHYVPTFRVLTDEDAKVVHKGGLSVSKAIGRATGSDEKLLPLHVSLARQAMTVTRNGTINRLGNALLETRDANKEVMSQYIRKVEDAESGFNEDTFDEEERVEPEKKKNVITIIEDGKRYELTLDDGLTQAFEAFEPSKWDKVEALQYSKKLVDLYKKLITAYNPLFVVRNALKDVQDAMLYSKDLTAWGKNLPLAYREMLQEGKYWQMYKGLGGNYASIFDYATGEVTTDGTGAIGKLEALNRIVEAAPRLAEFMAMVKKAEARGEVTEADLMEAFEAAQDITTNFGRAGSLGKMANKYFVPFLNPSIQGADKFIRNLTERKGAKDWAQLVVRAAALGIAPAIINGLLHRDDEDWEEEWDDISDATKANYYLFKLRDGVWIKIPRGRALAVLGAAGVAASETIKGNDIDPTELLEVIKDNIAPQNPLEANIFKAWFDAKLFNKDNPGQTWYGSEIESEYMQSFRPGERYDSSTDYISRWLGKTFDLSPAKINYLIDQYSGVLGDLFLPYITPESSAGLFNVGGVPLGIGIRKNFGVDTVTSNETTGEWYDTIDELKWDMNGGDIAAGTTSQYMSKANQVVSDYYRQIREIEADPELNNQEKQELTRALRKELIEYQKEILETEEKYRLAAEDYYDEHPELDHEDPEAVKAYMEQYNAQQATEEYYKNADQTKSLMEAIVYREVNREVLGAEYALETYSDDVYERAVKVHDGAGVSYDTYYDYYFGTKDMHADRDENGESISGTKKAKVLGFIAGMDISDEQKDALAIDAGYKAGSWKSYGEGKSGSGGGRGRKTKAVKIKSTLTKPVGISYNRSMSVAARTPGKEISAYEGIRKATSELRKKNPWYALPTGNPELDEEPPAAARYFATGRW